MSFFNSQKNIIVENLEKYMSITSSTCSTDFTDFTDFTGFIGAFFNSQKNIIMENLEKYIYFSFTVMSLLIVVFSFKYNEYKIQKKLQESRTELQKLKDKNWGTFTLKVGKFINEIKRLKTPYQKRKRTRKLFTYLLKNIEIIHNNPEFDIVVKNKLIEFYVNDNWNYARNMYKKMFGEQIPEFLLFKHYYTGQQVFHYNK